MKYGIIAILLSVALCIDTFELTAFKKFQRFVEKYDKKYDTVEEYMARFNIFKKNLLKFKSIKKNYRTGINQFSDMTQTEFRKTYLNLNINALNQFKYNKVRYQVRNDLPESFNWIDEGVLGKVKNQASCGSCWAFSTVGNIEARYYINFKTSVRLSEQQLVDCDTEYDEGCNGGLMEYAFAYLEKNGLESEDDYPYTGYDGTCAYSSTKAVALVSNYTKLDSTDETEIQSYLYTQGPLAIAINADPFQYYSGGIIDEDESSCDPESLNHGVVLVGWGTSSGTDYWIIRNSWGTSWGEKGYVRVARGKGTCGVNTYVTAAEVEKFSG